MFHFIQSQTWKQLGLLLQELPPKRVRFMGFVLAASLFQGILDMLLVGLLARIVGLLAGVKLEDQIPGIKFFGGGLLDQAGWLVLLLVASFWIASGIRLVVAWMVSMLTADVWSDLVNKVYRNLLLQKYEYFKHQRTAHLSDKFNRIINRVSTSVISPLIVMAGNLFSVLVLLIGVAFVLGGRSLLIFAMMLLAYILTSRLLTPYLRHASRQKIRYSKRINQMLMESLRSMADVHLYSAEDFFFQRFAQDGAIAKRYDRLAQLLPEVPRYIIEPAAITILFAVGMLPSILSGDTSKVREALPALAAILVTLLRIAQPLQSAFRNLNRLRAGLPEIEDALALLQMKPSRMRLAAPGVPTPAGMAPKRFIRLDNVCFRYEGSKRDVLTNIDLTIPVGSRVALVGRTGSGKTTIAHLILGLFRASSGNLSLDGVPLTEEEWPAWQANCALVPQDIRLLDASVRQNVAFGKNSDSIDDDEVWMALEAAQFADYVSEMPYGLYTVIGENGVKLSGGQRQRLSLARAFYRHASVLVLDEATSALDNKTERDVLQALDILGRRCTTIVIAHRLSTVRKCDRIYEIENGCVKAAGDYEGLIAMSSSFREMTMLDRP